MSITTPNQPIAARRYSEATLVLETDNSIYALKVGMSRSLLTCVRGTFAGQVTRTDVVGLPRIVLDTWRKATGMSDLGQNRDMADMLVQNVLADQPYRFQFPAGSDIVTSPVSVARWVLSEREILEPAVRTAMTAAVHVTHGKRTFAVTRSKCWACDEVVDLTDISNYALSRVRGDSRWGYEPGHQKCHEAAVDQMNG